MILDSGERKEFDTGAKRDVPEGKGNFFVAPLSQMADFLKVWNEDVDYETRIVGIIGAFVSNCRIGVITADALYEALKIFCFKAFKGDVNTMFLEVAVHFEEGSKKYGYYNWQKGIPFSNYIDSACRHLCKYFRGDTDERHDRAFVWNILCLIWTAENMPEMNNLRREE